MFYSFWFLNEKGDRENLLHTYILLNILILSIWKTLIHHVLSGNWKDLENNL